MKLSEYKIDKQFIYLFFIAICSIDLFSINGLVNVGRFIYFIFFILSIPSIIYFKFKPTTFTGSLILLLIAIILSCISSFIYHSQGFIDSCFALFFSIIGYFFYFNFLQKKIKSDTVEKVIVLLGLVYILFFFFSFCIYPKNIFYNPYNDKNNLFQGDEDRGLQRVILNGWGFLYLSYFLSLNKLICKKNLFWLFLCIISFVSILLTLTRLTIVAVCVITFFYIVSKFKLIGKAIVIFLFFLIFLFLFNLSFIQKLTQNSIQEFETIENYVRLQEVNYFLGEFQQSPYTYIVGNGFERTTSAYGKKIENLKQLNNYYTADIGIIGIFVYLGILGVIAFFLIFIKALSVKLPKEYLYLKLFIIFTISHCLTANVYSSLDYLIPIVFVLYLFEKNRLKIITS